MATESKLQLRRGRHPGGQRDSHPAGPFPPRIEWLVRHQHYRPAGGDQHRLQPELCGRRRRRLRRQRRGLPTCGCNTPRWMCITASSITAPAMGSWATMPAPAAWRISTTSSFTNNAGYAVNFQDGSVNPVLSNLTATGNGAIAALRR